MEKADRIWRVFTFAGWWLVFLGVALSVLFLVSYISTNFAAIALSLVGLVLALIGEAILSQHQDKQHRFIWEGLTLGGIFCLSAGLFWIAYLYAIARSIVGLFVLIIAGVILVFIGETKLKFATGKIKIKPRK